MTKDEFMSKVEQIAGVDCWLWKGCIARDGYGLAWIKGKRFQAHRLGWTFFKGAITNPMILHTCDIRSCVNPDHLYSGTHAENMTDRKVRNRTAKGSKISSSIVNESQVLQIKGYLKIGMPYRQVADLVKTTYDVVRDIARGRNWQWLV